MNGSLSKMSSKAGEASWPRKDNSSIKRGWMNQIELQSASALSSVQGIDILMVLCC